MNPCRLCKFDALFDRLNIKWYNRSFWKRSHCRLFEGAWNEVLVCPCLDLTRLRKDGTLRNGIFLEISGGNKHFLITKETFVNRFQKVFKNLNKEEIENIFNSLDQNETGNIEYEELIRALSDKKKLLSDKNLNEAFKFFDRDNNGFITWNEIAEIIYPDGKMPRKIILEFLEEIGQKDENMEINFEDFKTILQQKK